MLNRCNTISEKQIEQRISELAKSISNDSFWRYYSCRVIKGAFLFAADLARKADISLQIDFIVASSQ